MILLFSVGLRFLTGDSDLIFGLVMADLLLV